MDKTRRRNNTNTPPSTLSVTLGVGRTEYTRRAHIKWTLHQ